MDTRWMAFHQLPPCQAACPIKMDVQGYLSAIAREDFESSTKIIRDTNPLPSVCGRVCTHPCEEKCRRGPIDEPLSIRKLKRFPLDCLGRSGRLREIESQLLTQTAPAAQKPRKVAIVGSGPAGLTCAHDLALLGYKVSIFEVLPVLGGMLRVGIPEYRLTRKELQRDIDFILKLGVEVETGEEVGKDITLEVLTDDFDAVFLAVGCHRPLTLGIAGESLRGITSGTSFLKKIALGEKVSVGEKVVVVGGGNTAVDAARTSLRLGSQEVSVVYRRSEEEMPAYPWDVKEAQEEGIIFNFLTAPTEFRGDNGRVSSVRCVKTALAEVGRDGRKRPVPVPHSEFLIPADAVLLSIGQAPDHNFVGSGSEIKFSKPGRIIVHESSLGTHSAGIFAGGDAVTGPKTVIEAMAAGRKAALNINNYLEHGSLKGLEEKKVQAIGEVPPSAKEAIKKFPRLEGLSLAEEVRVNSFDEVELGYNPAEGVKEAQRCLNCGAGAFVLKERCIACLTCLRVCPFDAPYIYEEKAQISSRACQACGICVAECPEKAIILKSGEDERIERELQALLKNKGSLIPVFICAYGLYSGASSEVNLSLPKEAKVIKVLCSAKISQDHLLRAFELGAEGAFVVSCQGQTCHFTKGSFWANKRVGYVQRILKDLDFGEERLKVFNLEPPYAEKVRELVQKSVQSKKSQPL